MLLLRKIGTVLLYAWAAGWAAKVLFDWLLGLDGATLIIPSVLVTMLGAIAGISEARALGPQAR